MKNIITFLFLSLYTLLTVHADIDYNVNKYGVMFVNFVVEDEKPTIKRHAVKTPIEARAINMLFSKFLIPSVKRYLMLLKFIFLPRLIYRFLFCHFQFQ